MDILRWAAPPMMVTSEPPAGLYPWAATVRKYLRCRGTEAMAVRPAGSMAVAGAVLLVLEVGCGGAARVAFTAGDALGDALMRPGSVIVHLVLGQDGPQVCLAEDQHAVQELAAKGADEPLASRVHTRSLDRSAQGLAPVAWKTASNEAVKFEPRSRIRNLIASNRSSRLRARLRACWTVQSPVGFAVTPPRCIRRVPCSMNTRTYSLLSSTVSTCRKSTATIPAA